MELDASISDFFSAVYNGAPTPEATERATAQVTAVIALYICFVAIFVIGVYIRAIGRKKGLREERRTFSIWIAWSLMFSVIMIAAYVGHFLLSST